MGKMLLKYSFGAIFLYLGVAYATSGGQLISATTNGGATLIRAFQARG